MQSPTRVWMDVCAAAATSAATAAADHDHAASQCNAPWPRLAGWSQAEEAASLERELAEARAATEEHAKASAAELGFARSRAEDLDEQVRARCPSRELSWPGEVGGWIASVHARPPAVFSRGDAGLLACASPACVVAMHACMRNPA